MTIWKLPHKSVVPSSLRTTCVASTSSPDSAGSEHVTQQVGTELAGLPDGSRTPRATTSLSTPNLFPFRSTVRFSLHASAAARTHLQQSFAPRAWHGRRQSNCVSAPSARTTANNGYPSSTTRPLARRSPSRRHLAYPHQESKSSSFRSNVNRCLFGRTLAVEHRLTTAHPSSEEVPAAGTTNTDVGCFRRC